MYLYILLICLMIYSSINDYKNIIVVCNEYFEFFEVKFFVVNILL